MQLKLKYLYTLTNIINGTYIVDTDTNSNLFLCVKNKKDTKMSIDEFKNYLKVRNIIHLIQHNVNNIGFPIELLPDIKDNYKSNFDITLNAEHIEKGFNLTDL